MFGTVTNVNGIMVSSVADDTAGENIRKVLGDLTGIVDDPEVLKSQIVITVLRADGRVTHSELVIDNEADVHHDTHIELAANLETASGIWGDIATHMSVAHSSDDSDPDVVRLSLWLGDVEEGNTLDYVEKA